MNCICVSFGSHVLLPTINHQELGGETVWELV